MNLSTPSPLARTLAVACLGAAMLSACQQAPTPDGSSAEVADRAQPPVSGFDLASATLVDLSHPYDEDTIYWPTEDGFQLEVNAQGMTDGGYYYEAFSFTSAEHGGTHLDAPVHFAEGRRAVDQIPLRDLIAPGVVIDVRDAAQADADYQVRIADFEAWESQHGPLPTGSIVLLDTGNAAHWPDRVAYMGTDERGPEAVALLHFPGLHPDAATWLVAERDIAAIGLDTPSIDFGQSTLFEAHRILFEANIPAFENVADMSELPPLGFTVFALPMKIGKGSGAPLRIVAVVPGER